MFVGKHFLRPNAKITVSVWFRPHKVIRMGKRLYHIRFPCDPLRCNLRSLHPLAI